MEVATPTLTHATIIVYQTMLNILQLFTQYQDSATQQYIV